MSRYTDLGDAVVTSLNDETFSIDFTSTRKYRPVMELKELSTLTVTILTPSVTQEITSRSTNNDMMLVDVLVQKQSNPDDNSDTDLLMDLLEELAEHFRDVHFSSSRWVRTEIISTYDIEDLSDYRLFSGLVRVTYEQHWVK